MGVRPRSGNELSRIPEAHGKLLVTKNGVYLVRGDSKLRNLELISWEQLLGPARGSAPAVTIPRPVPFKI
jgi:hypothetical protein